MKNIADGMMAHLAQEVTTLAYLIRINRRDGVVFGFTSHDADVEIGGVVYHAQSAFSLLRGGDWRSGLRDRVVDVEGVLDSDLLRREDIEAGLFDRALVDVGVCNWARVEDGIVPLRRGWIGDVVVSGERYVASFHGLQDLLKRKIGDVYTPLCRHALGDGLCRVDLAAQTYAGVVEMIDGFAFVDTRRTESAGVFAFGVLLWTSGALQGSRMDVVGHDPLTGRVELRADGVLRACVGDAYQIVVGCDKRFSTCCARFSNGKNFGGFPHLAGLAKVLMYPESS